MFRAKLLVCGVLVAGAVATSAPVALAAAPESPGCAGRTVALINHNSGPFGASGNPNASAGPGYFLGTSTAAAVHAAQAGGCS